MRRDAGSASPAAGPRGELPSRPAPDVAPAFRWSPALVFSGGAALWLALLLWALPFPVSLPAPGGHALAKWAVAAGFALLIAGLLPNLAILALWGFAGVTLFSALREGGLPGVAPGAWLTALAAVLASQAVAESATGGGARAPRFRRGPPGEGP